MATRTWPVNAQSGAPAYSGRALRQSSVAPLVGGATASRPLGARSGVRPGTSTSTVTATSTTWTVKPHAGILDLQAAAEAGPYGYAIDADVTGSVTAASASIARVDIVWVRIDDPSESDGSSAPGIVFGYTAGTVAATPPATPARSMVLAWINVPIAGGGAPTVTWKAPYLAAPGAPIRVRSDAERDALLTIYGATAEAPLWVEHIGSTNPRAGNVERNAGSGWSTVAWGMNTGWTNATLRAGSGWADFGSGFRVPGYQRLDGMGELRGTVKGGTGTIFTLPPGFRPAADEAFIILTNVGAADLRVTTNGDVQVASYIAGGWNAIVSLTGVRFAADGS